MEKWTVDIIIPTYKPDQRFEELLRRLDRQIYPLNKILIMNTEKQYWDQNHLDEKLFGKESLCKRTETEVHHLRAEEFDHGGTRAQAAAMSQADILLFMTQDAMPADKYLVRHLIQVFEENAAVGAAYARQLPEKNCHFLERYTRSFNYGEESRIKTAEDLPTLGIKTFFCSNVCAAYRRAVYEKLGGFEKHTIFNEDMIFAGHLIQAGMGIAYVAEAKVIHSHNYSGLQQFHRNFDLAVSQVDHPEVFEGVRSESEGIRLVKKSAVHVLKSGKIWLLPKLIWQSGWKYLGYRMGRNYQKLPMWLIQKFTMNEKYWKNKVF